MNRSSHPCVHQANQLEVAGSREMHGIGFTADRRAGGHASRVVEAGSIGCSPRTSHEDTEHGAIQGRSDLARLQEGYGMDLVRGESPTDAVAGMNPKLIRQKGQRLLTQVRTLGTHVSLP